MLAAIDALKAQLDARRPLTADEVRGLQSVFDAERTDYIFESNAIEGNALTLAETEVVLTRGLTVAGKPLKDHLEAKNHLEAFGMVEDLARNRIPLSETILLQLHAIILRSIEDEWAGRYRNVRVRIAGARHVPPNPAKVPELMEELFGWYRGCEQTSHPVEVAADLHHRLAHVHPFIDGNGRLCRLAMNLHLIRHGYPLTIIRSASGERVRYYDALAATDERGEPAPFREFVAARVLDALHRYAPERPQNRSGPHL